MPEIEHACMDELGDKCAGQLKEGEVSVFLYILFLFFALCSVSFLYTIFL